MAGQFCLRFQLPRKSQGSFYMPQICDMGQTALLPHQRKACCGFFARKIRRLQPGSNPRSWVPEASMLIPRPPKLLTPSVTKTERYHFVGRGFKSSGIWYCVWWVVPSLMKTQTINWYYNPAELNLQHHCAELIITIIIIFLHELGHLICSGINTLPSFPGTSTISSPLRFVVEGMFWQSGVVRYFKIVDPALFVFGSHVLYCRDL
jgi:hypothetical protein